MSNPERFVYLLQLYTDGELSSAEHDELFTLIASAGYDQLLAKVLMQDLQSPLIPMAADLPPHIAEEMVRKIISAEKDTARVLPLRRNIYRWWKWAAAAILILVFGGFFLLRSSQTSNGQLAKLIPAGAVHEYNAGAKPRQIRLSDGTEVTLQPGSSLYYNPAFALDKREVFLEGEGFFQVTKNPRRPFLVYYKNIVTKVLGTSFTINTDPTSGNVEVAVRTGRVQVFENAKLLDEEAGKSVIITPNQKVVYKSSARLFETALVEKPQPIMADTLAVDNIVPVSFVYDQQRLPEIFKDLENKYGIEIIPENTNLNNCVFTGDVSNQDLYTKLKIICLTTKASYEINGTRILIKGEGCN